jgi:LmbE family N-acetylglucosaminyl deacetylase
MLESLRNKRIMVVVAHPDDEVLGPGGTLYRLINEFNCTIHVVILGEGITSRSHSRDIQKWEAELKRHHINILEAKEKIGYQTVATFDFPDNRFDSVSLLDIIKVIENEKKLFSPDVIFTHHGGDLNIDHQRTFEAVITCNRPLSFEKVSTIITFETMSGTEWRASSDPRHFIPNMIVEIGEEGLNAKIEAMETYMFEKRNYPHPRSSEAIKIRSQMWGIANGMNYGEAFQIIRTIVKI